MKKISITIFIILTCYSSLAQVQIKGIIKSKNSNETLPYVNIGIIGKGVGTVSNDNGDFEIFMSKRYFSDSVKVSMIGYVSETYLVKDFIKIIKNNNTIYLQENIEELDEIVVTNRKLKRRVLGNRTKLRLYSDGFESDQLGSEAGIIIKIKKSPTYIKEFTAFISKNEHPEIKFRLNFYDIKNGMPNKLILKENIIVTSTIKKGKLIVDLEKYNIVVEEDFFVSLEWIEYFGKGELNFAIGFFGSPVIYRYASQGIWTKDAPLAPGFNVTVDY